jgi:hypothetical protein
MPFDQLYWNAGVAFADKGEMRSSSETVEKFGETTTRDPDSTFVPLSASNNNGSYNDGVSTHTGNTVVGGVGTRVILSDANMATLFSNGKTFCGIHKDDPISVTWSGRPAKGFYVVLEHTGFRNAGLFANPNTTLDYFGGYEFAATRGLQFWSASVYRNNNLLKPTTYLTINGDGTARGTAGTNEIRITSSSLTDIEEEFAEGFKIKVVGQTYEVTKVSASSGVNRLTLTSNIIGSSFSLHSYEVLIPEGSPDTGTIYHPTISSTSSSAETIGSYDNKTWGFVPVKWSYNGDGGAASADFETTGPLNIGGDDVKNYATRSPHFSEKGRTNSNTFSQESAGAFSLASSLSRAFWPKYQVDYRSEFSTTVNGLPGGGSIGYNGNDDDVFSATYGGTVSSIAKFGIPGVTTRIHGNASDEVEDFEMMHSPYPYVQADYAHDGVVMNDSSAGLTARAYLTLFESDDVLPPGETIKASWATNDFFSLFAMQFWPTDFFHPAWLGGATPVGMPDLGKYKLHIVAKE